MQCNGGFTTITGWSTIQSPDYFSTYCANNFRGIPFNTFGNSYPKHGNSHVGIEVYYDHPTIEIKEYIYQHLNAPLKIDTTYCLSFFLKLGSRTTISIKNIGSLFTTNIPSTGASWYIQATPQVLNTAGFITDTINWTEIQGCFTALGGEQYIAIGNFSSNANTDTATAYSNNPLTGTGSHISYYYLDSVTLYQNNFPTKVNEFGKENKLSVWPNPTEGSLTLALSEGEGIEPKQCVIKITDVLGRENFVSEYKEQLNISALEKGIYFITILQGSKTLGVKKIIKQ